MNPFRRLFGGPLRQAQALEAAGKHREAAAAYAQAGNPERAAEVLGALALRTAELPAQIAAYEDALRLAPAESPVRKRIASDFARAIVDAFVPKASLTSAEVSRLRDAASMLETVGDAQAAARAYARLGAADDQERALVAAGDVEGLEAALDARADAERKARTIRARVEEHELALKTGARSEAAEALRQALALGGQDPALVDLSRRLEARWPRLWSVQLRVDGVATLVAGRLPMVLGRAGADVEVRGASVSRRHAVIEPGGSGGCVVRDLGSRNGTLVHGVPLAGALEIGGELEISLGQDVTLSVAPTGPGGVLLRVTRGLDEGRVVVVGAPPIALPNTSLLVEFPQGRATVRSSLDEPIELDGQPCRLGVTLLVGDVLRTRTTTVEVLA